MRSDPEGRVQNSGTAILHYVTEEYCAPFTLKIEDVDQETFKNTCYSLYEGALNKKTGSSFGTEIKIPSIEEGNPILGAFYEQNVSQDELKEDDNHESTQEVEHMSDLSRNELQALLKANKAEVDSVASSMKTEMASFREQMRGDLNDIKSLLEGQSSKIEHGFSSQNSKIEHGLLTQNIKLDAAIQIQTGKMENAISNVKIDIIKWVLGLPALAFTLWKIYEALK